MLTRTQRCQGSRLNPELLRPSAGECRGAQELGVFLMGIGIHFYSMQLQGEGGSLE